MHLTNRRLAVLIITIVIFGVLSLGGLLVMGQNLDDTRSLITSLNYNASRGDCIRGVQADADQEFHRSISSLFDANRDPVKIEAIRKRMREQPNWADTVERKCPPSLAEP